MDTIESVRFQTIHSETENRYQNPRTQHDENEGIFSTNVDEEIKDYSFTEIQAHDLEHYRRCQIGISCSQEDYQVDVCRNVINQIIGDGVQTHWSFSRLVKCFSDRDCSKVKFSQVLAEYKSDILPLIIEEYGSLSQTEKKMMSLINQLLCGLHLIVGLAHQAKITLLLWDNMIFGEQLVCAGAHSLRYVGPTELESGTVRAVRTLSNAFQTLEFVEFKTFLTSKGEFDEQLFSPSSVNRIDSLFHNAAGLYSICNDLLQFTSGCTENISLLEDVAADLKVQQFRAGCRALGLFFKFVIQPFWKALTLSGDLLKMNIRYQILIGKLKEWHIDGKSLVDGNVCLFDDIEVEGDPVLDKLTMSIDEGCFELTVQIVELLSYSFLKVCHQILPIDLEPSDDIRERNDLVSKMDDHSGQSLNVPLHSQKAKSNATCFALEGMFVSKRHRSWKWLSLLDKEKTVSVLKTLKQTLKLNKILNKRRKVFVRSKFPNTKNKNMAVDMVTSVQLRPAKEMSWKVEAMTKIKSQQYHKSASCSGTLAIKNFGKRVEGKELKYVSKQIANTKSEAFAHQSNIRKPVQVKPKPGLEVLETGPLQWPKQCTRQGTLVRGHLDALSSVSLSPMRARDNVTMEHYLTQKLTQYGGQWKHVKDIDKNVAMIDAKDRYAALVSQLLFHRFVLGFRNKHGVFNTSCAGRRLQLSELVDNLKRSLLTKR